jgi:ABC-type bacteriocin/lantibiotic exporter with double-glycine peptidase domain
MLVSRCNIGVGFVTLVVVVAASQQCQETALDAVSLIQARSNVASRKGIKRNTLRLSIDETFENEDVFGGLDEAVTMKVDNEAQFKETNVKERSFSNQADINDRAAFDTKFASRVPGKRQSWWAHRPYPWLLPVGMSAISIATFIVSQLVAISPLRAARSNHQSLPAGEAAMAKGVIEADDDKPVFAAPSSVLSWCSLSLANKLFSAEGRHWMQDCSNSSRSPLCKFLDISQGDNASSAHEQFQACWVQQVVKCNNSDVHLLKVLYDFVGWQQLLLIAGLVMGSFALNCFAMVVSLEFLLGYVEWLNTQNDALVAPDPFWSSLMVLVIFCAAPLVGSCIEELLRLRDARIGARITAALATAICQKAQRAPASNVQPEGSSTIASAQNLITDIAEASTSAMRMLMQCAMAPINMVLLFIVLWRRVGISSLLVVIAFIPLLAVSRQFLGAIVPARVAHQVAYDKWLLLFQNTLKAILEVKSCGWEAPLMNRLTESRDEALGAIWTMQNMGQQIVFVSVAWPRLVIIVVLTGYGLMNPIVDGIALFTCLQVLGYMTYLISAFSLGTAKAKVIIPLAARVEEFLKLPEAPGQPSQPLSERNGGLSIQGSFSWRANDKPVLHGVDISIPKGALAAIVGESGSGKTSIFHAALGELYPKSDQVDQKAVAHTAAYSSQSPWIFADTLRENIVLGAHEIDRSRYTDAVRAAGLQLDIEAMPTGDATMVTRHGGILTSSQCVRIAWARCLYSSEELVLIDDSLSILDEDPTTAIDEAVHRRLIHDPLLQGRTRLIAMPPDASALQGFDLVIVMAEGRIVESGSPKNVLQTPAFKNLAQQSGIGALPRSAYSSFKEAATSKLVPLPRSAGESVPLGATQHAEVNASSVGSLLRLVKILGMNRAVTFVWLIFIAQGLMVLMDLSLSQWANEVDMSYEVRAARSQFCVWPWVYVLCLIISVSVGIAANMFGASCSQVFSNDLHDSLIRSALSASFRHAQTSICPSVNGIVFRPPQRRLHIMG